MLTNIGQLCVVPSQVLPNARGNIYVQGPAMLEADDVELSSTSFSLRLGYSLDTITTIMLVDEVGHLLQNYYRR